MNEGLISISKAILSAVLLLLPIFNCQAQSGNCLDFDGSNDYVTLNTLADDMAGSTNFTIEFWVKGPQSQPSPSGQAGLVSVNTSSGGNVLLFVMGTGFIGQQWDGKIYVFDGVIGWYQINGPYIGDDNWHQVVYTRSGSTANLVVDGAAAGSHSPAYGFSASDLWTIGQEYDGGPTTSDFFRGQIDGLKIYNGSTLVGDYDFNQGTPGGNNAGQTTLMDGSGNSNNGTLLNFALNGSTSNWIASSAPLPVELLDFQAKSNENTALLSWRTASETNNLGFHIQKSTDGRQFETLGFTAGSGFSHEERSYFFKDGNFSTSAYYRLRQIDLDGQEELSKLIFLEKEKSLAFQLYPNPAADWLTLVGLHGDETATLTLTDARGQVVWVKQVASPAEHILNISDLQPGIFFLDIRQEARREVLRLAKR